MPLASQDARKNQLTEEGPVSVGISIVNYLFAPPVRGDRLDRGWDHPQRDSVARIGRCTLEVAPSAIRKQVGFVRADPRSRYGGGDARGESTLEVPQGPLMPSTKPVVGGVAVAGMLPTHQVTENSKRVVLARKTGNKEVPPPLGACSLAQRSSERRVQALCQRWGSVAQGGWACGVDGVALVAHG